jgi:hypothetical protein
MSKGTATAPAATVLNGPLDYDKPKGLGAAFVKLLCLPSDAMDLQALTKGIIKLFMLFFRLTYNLCFLIIPLWLWLIRHEFSIGHVEDAAIIAVGGMTLFVFSDAAVKAAVRTEASRDAGVFKAGQPIPYAKGLSAPSSNAVAIKANGTAAPAGATARAAPAVAPAARSAAAPGAPVASAQQHQSASANDPVVRQVKQRIIKLERILYGNELSEADIAPDALHARVVTLCTELGVPCGAPGGSGAHDTLHDLDRQLQAVEKALGVA